MSTTKLEAELTKEVMRLRTVLKDIHSMAIIWAEQLREKGETIHEKKARHIGIMALRALGENTPWAK